MKIQLFVPCYIDQFYPETGINTVKVLEKAGCDIIYNRKQTCCGQPFFNGGHQIQAKKLAKKFYRDFGLSLPIVTPSASCAAYVLKHYQSLLSAEEFEILKHKGVYELSDFLVNILNYENTGATFNHKITWHYSCHAMREYNLKEEPFKLLKNVTWLKLLEIPKPDVCCGFGGTFSIKHKEISQAMTKEKVENAVSTGAEYIVSSEASCLLNLQAYINKNKIRIKTIHYADILANF